MIYDNYMKRMQKSGMNIGSILKQQSDLIMDKTFYRDIAYRKCYILKKGCIFPKQTLDGYKQAKSVYVQESYYNPSLLDDFQKIDAKYLVNKYYSIDGDNVDYYLQFRPNAHGTNPNIRVGTFVFVPDDLGNYNLWLIVAKDDRPQFPQFYILRCNMLVKWMISEQDVKLYSGEHVDTGTYVSWAVKRTQNSYNSGVWQDRIVESVENHMKFWFPTNEDTMTITYNKRFIISYNSKRQTVWRVSKVEDTEPVGLTKITCVQTLDKQDEDGKLFVNHLSSNYSDTTFDYYTDYYKSRENDSKNHINASIEHNMSNVIAYSGSKSSLKIGGSVKTYKANFYNENGDYVNRKPYWTLSFYDNDLLIGKIDTIYFDNTVSDDSYIGWVVNCDRSDPNISYQVLSENGLYSESYNENTNQYSDKCIVMCTKDNNVIFGIEITHDTENPDDLNIKCLRYLSMVGKTFDLLAVDADDMYSASLKVEVESL